MYRDPFVLNDNGILEIPFYNDLDDNLMFGMTTRRLGTFSSNPCPETSKKNGETLEKLIGTSQKIKFSNQQHSNTIKKVDSFNKSDDFGVVDGLYTYEKELPLGCIFADCTPVFFYVPSREIIGIVHAGWEGTTKGIAAEMVRILRDEENVDPTEIIVTIGPSISFHAMEVESDTIDKVNQLDERYQPETGYIETNLGKYKLDVRKLNYNQLVVEGVDPVNILATCYCTKCDEDLFFSHRRQDPERMCAFVYRK